MPFPEESHSGSRGIAPRSEDKTLKKTEPVKRKNGVCVDDKNAVIKKDTDSEST